MSGALIPLRSLLQQGSLTAARAVAVAALCRAPALGMTHQVGTSAATQTLGPASAAPHHLLLLARGFHASGAWAEQLTVKVRDVIG